MTFDEFWSQRTVGLSVPGLPMPMLRDLAEAVWQAATMETARDCAGLTHEAYQNQMAADRPKQAVGASQAGADIEFKYRIGPFEGRP
jgi:hypothetical protein